MFFRFPAIAGEKNGTEISITAARRLLYHIYKKKQSKLQNIVQKTGKTLSKRQKSRFKRAQKPAGRKI